MILGVSGSRYYHDYNEFCYHMNLFLQENNVTKIIVGDQVGADEMTIKYATQHKIPHVIIPANWALFKKRAGTVRNESILNRSDFILAFWDERTVNCGTYNMIKQAYSQSIVFKKIIVKVKK